MAHVTEDIRNIVLVGHGHSGKTAVLDTIAFHAKVQTRIGNSADGSTISNSDPEEKERKQTLAAHFFGFRVGNVQLNIIDTPGHADFAAPALAAMRACETACLCVNANSPLPFHARRLWDEAGRAGCARAILVTHLDQENTSFERAVEDLRAQFGHIVVPVTYPDGGGAGLHEIFSVMQNQGPLAGKYHDQIEEEEAEVDDTLMEHYLEAGHLSADEFEANIGRAMATGHLVPVFAVCPTRDKGLRKFEDFVCRYFPSPKQFGARGAAAPGSKEASTLIEPDPAGPFAAQVCKVVNDPYVGRLAYLRCYRGTLKAEQTALHVRSGKVHKVAHPQLLAGRDLKETPQVVAGDLFVVGKIDELNLGDTVTAEGSPLEFPVPVYPKPTYSQHIWPKARGDEQKIGHALEKLGAEDPTFQHLRDKETGEHIASGMSPLHLEVQFQRLHSRYHVGVDHGPPTIPYRETITARADGHHRHKKQSGGRGQFAEVYLRVAPKNHGEGFEYIDSVVGGSIPRGFIPEVEKGIRKFLQKGALAGFQVVDVAAEVYDGKYHDVDSDQISFQLAGERAFLDGYLKARPILLEPIMDVVIHIPERFTGDVAGNLSSSRGRMSGMEVEDGVQTIKAQVPLASMLDYSTQLRSITAGEGTFTMEFAHYEAVPPHLQAEIVARRKKVIEEEHK